MYEPIKSEYWVYIDTLQTHVIRKLNWDGFNSVWSM